MRFELRPAKGDDPHAEVTRLLALGATRLEGEQEVAGRVSLADPDGNEFGLRLTTL